MHPNDSDDDGFVANGGVAHIQLICFVGVGIFLPVFWCIPAKWILTYQSMQVMMSSGNNNNDDNVDDDAIISVIRQQPSRGYHLDHTKMCHGRWQQMFSKPSVLDKDTASVPEPSPMCHLT